MFLIKLTGMKHRTPCQQIFSPFTHPGSESTPGWGKTFFFQKKIFCILSNKKERSLEHYAIKLFGLICMGLVKRSDIEIVQISIQSNLVDYPKLLGYSKTRDSPDFFLYYL